MAAHKTYEWEHRQFPWHWKVRIKPQFAAILTDKLARRFGVATRVELTNRSWGRYHHGIHLITLPSSGCSLGMICHEIAHAVNDRLYRGKGHTGTFKRALIKVMVEAKPMLPAVFRELRATMASLAKDQQRLIDRAIRAEQQKKRAKEMKKTPAYRIEQRRRQVKKLETRIKRLQTALKRARRSLGALERHSLRAGKNPPSAPPGRSTESPGSGAGVLLGV